MPVLFLDALKAALPKGQRLLGLDLGTKTIGLAISDPGLAIASPLALVKRSRFKADAARLAEFVREREVGGLVLGLPVNMDGSEGRRAQATRAFAANLVAVLGLPLAFWDERLTTAAVERALISEADLSRARRAALVDKLAAAYILQGALDYLRRKPRPL